MELRVNSNSRVASRNIYLDGMSEPCEIDCNGIYMGRSRIYGLPFFLDLGKLVNKNMAVLGMSGSGKSFLMKSFVIRSAFQRGSSVLVMDWNNEYRDTIAFLGGATLTLGMNFNINVFDIYDLMNVRNIRLICDFITHSINLDKEEGYALYSSILSLRKVAGKSSLNLKNLISYLESGPDELSHRIAVKLHQLKGNPMLAEKTDFPIGKMLEGLISMDFSKLRDDYQREEISRAMFRIIIEIMHRSSLGECSPDKEKIIVLDEGWRFVKNLDDVGTLFREGRKYGFCIALATQLVGDINNEVLSNSACVVVFRLQNDSDYRLLLDSGVISEKDAKEIQHLPRGSCMVAAVYNDKGGRIRKFCMGSTDGIATGSYVIGGEMQDRISHRKFMECTRALQASGDKIEQLVNFIAGNNNEVDSGSLVKFMLDLGIERAEIVYYFRRLGLNDIDIVKAFAAVETRVKRGA